MKKIILLGVALLSLSKIALASGTSDVLLLDNAIIEPKQSFSIPLDPAKLAANVSYDITCDKIYSSVKEDIDVYYYAASSKAILDGAPVQSNVMQLKADHYAPGYTLKFENVIPRNLQAIEFTNLDDKAVVSIFKCVARVHH